MELDQYLGDGDLCWQGGVAFRVIATVDTGLYDPE